MNLSGQESFNFLDIEVFTESIDVAFCSKNDQVTDSSLFLTILESSPDRAYSPSEDMLKLFGFKKEQLQRSLKQIFGPYTNSKNFTEFLKTAFAGLECADYFTFYKRNGDELGCHARASLTEVEGIRAVRLSLQVTGGSDHSPCSVGFLETTCSPCRNRVQAFADIDKATTLPEIDNAVIIHMKAVRMAAISAQAARQP
jgi:hypothetical protein